LAAVEEVAGKEVVEVEEEAHQYGAMAVKVIIKLMQVPQQVVLL